MKDNYNLFCEVIGLLQIDLKEMLLNEYKGNDFIMEIRLLKDNPAIIKTPMGAITLKTPITQFQLEQSIYSLCNGSVHSFQRELAQGFIPLKNGHRAGIAGTVVYDDNGEIKAIRNISAIVLRVANKMFGVADLLFDTILKERLVSFIVVGPPCSGKTTYLRDIAKRLSEKSYSVVVADERQELFPDLSKCIVLKGCKKSDGITLAVRSLSPQVIICDEIATTKDAIAVSKAINCGAYIITSVHALNKEEFFKRAIAKELLASGCFEKAVFLNGFPKIGLVNEVIKL